MIRFVTVTKCLKTTCY